LIIAQYSVDLVPIFLRDRNPSLLLLLLLLLLRLLFLVSLKGGAMIFRPIVDHDDVNSVTHIGRCTRVQGLVNPRQTFVTVGQRRYEKAPTR
jgi:hypothetical protein